MESQEHTDDESPKGDEKEFRRDPFVRQVQDRALAAAQVLKEQRGDLSFDAPIQLFIP